MFILITQTLAPSCICNWWLCSSECEPLYQMMSNNSNKTYCTPPIAPEFGHKTALQPLTFQELVAWILLVQVPLTDWTLQGIYCLLLSFPSLCPILSPKDNQFSILYHFSNSIKKPTIIATIKLKVNIVFRDYCYYERYYYSKTIIWVIQAISQMESISRCI